MYRRIITMIAMCVIAALAITGCRPYHSSNSYFDGQLVIEFDQVQGRQNDDYMTYRFYGAGKYDFSFSTTPGKDDSNADKMPENFTVTVEQPRELIKNQYILPNFLRVTVTKDGHSEYHDFQ